MDDTCDFSRQSKNMQKAATTGSDSDEHWEEDDLDEEMHIPSNCLFCQQTFFNPDACWQHCLKDHDFDIDDYVAKLGMDCFSYMKMVNFIRSKKPAVKELKNFSKSTWHEESFLKPVYEDDGLLQYDIEDNCELSVSYDPEHVTLNENETILKQKVMELEKELARSKNDLASMKTVAQNFFYSVPDESSSTSTSPIESLKNDEDETYISSYSHHSIHQEMLKDSIRTNFYKDCIYQNSELFKDKVVLDVGCGTGILSMFAAKSGAKLVIGVEMSDIIYQAMDIVRENGLENKISLLKGRMEDVKLPVEKVDIIISEWMGYFLLFESMLDTVLWAREKYLTDDGYMIPDSSSVYITGMEDSSLFDDNIKFWENVYGFKMNSMKASVLEEALVQVVSDKNKFSDVCKLSEINVKETNVKALDYSTNFVLNTKEDITLTSIVGFFDVHWNKAVKPISMTTSPFKRSTHWKQTVFLLPAPVSLKSGEQLKGNFICKKNVKDPRSLIVYISYNGKTNKYYLQ